MEEDNNNFQILKKGKAPTEKELVFMKAMTELINTIVKSDMLEIALAAVMKKFVNGECVKCIVKELINDMKGKE